MREKTTKQKIIDYERKASAWSNPVLLFGFLSIVLLIFKVYLLSLIAFGICLGSSVGLQICCHYVKKYTLIYEQESLDRKRFKSKSSKKKKKESKYAGVWDN